MAGESKRRPRCCAGRPPCRSQRRRDAHACSSSKQPFPPACSDCGGALPATLRRRSRDSAVQQRAPGDINTGEDVYSRPFCHHHHHHHPDVTGTSAADPSVLIPPFPLGAHDGRRARSLPRRTRRPARNTTAALCRRLRRRHCPKPGPARSPYDERRFYLFFFFLCFCFSAPGIRYNKIYCCEVRQCARPRRQTLPTFWLYQIHAHTSWLQGLVCVCVCVIYENIIQLRRNKCGAGTV